MLQVKKDLLLYARTNKLSPRGGDQVDRLGGSAGKDNLLEEVRVEKVGS